MRAVSLDIQTRKTGPDGGARKKHVVCILSWVRFLQSILT